LVKQQMSTESAANDAKTLRLRALRLAKEAADLAAGVIQSSTPAIASRKGKSKPTR
jgi:hypothetical protein